MQIGMVGLGRMGANMTRRLMRGGHTCAVYDLAPAAVASLAGEGAVGAGSIDELVAALTPPRTVWLMVPAGAPTEKMVAAFGERLEAGDAVVDGGNSYYKDDVRRARELAARGVVYVDAGTSGGVWGLERGYCLMIGGDAATVERLDPIWSTLAPGRGDIAGTPGREDRTSTAERGYIHCGPAGAGHFVKMIHNGIEYGLMQAYAEGFDIMKHAASESLPEDQRYDLDLAAVAEVWRRGSVIGSWLLDLTARALAADPTLSGFTGHVADSGEGRWTVETALDLDVPAPVITLSLLARFRSRQEESYGAQVIAALRNQFGGHAVKAADPEGGSAG